MTSVRRRPIDDFYGPSDPFNLPPPPVATYGGSSKPRRHKSERHRRRPSPEIIRDDSFEPRRTRKVYDGPPTTRGSTVEPASSGHSKSRRRAMTPPPLGSEASRRGQSSSRGYSSKRGIDPEEAAFMRGRDYERDPYVGGRGGRMPPPSKEYPIRGRPASGGAPPRSSTFPMEPDARPRRSRGSPPESSPRPRPYGRDYRPPPPEYDYGPDEYYEPRRRPRSQAPPPPRGYPRDYSPPPSRGRAPPPAGAGVAAGRPSPRRSSMPAPNTRKPNPWWQNPLVKAGGKAAMTAGAQAAVRNKNDPAPWLGAKGAKVATAALGAMLVDGLLGSKTQGTGQQVAKTGVDAFVDETPRMYKKGADLGRRARS